MFTRHLVAVLGLAATAVVLGGCGAGTVSGTGNLPGGSSAAATLGHVMGGEQPVRGASVQLFAVGTTGEGSAATPLLRSSVSTDANGGFSLTGLYTCPSAATPVYLTATGGDPGIGRANPALLFDRDLARGHRLGIAAGTAVRFEPGVQREVELVPLAGAKVVPGLRLDGGLDG